MIFFKQYLRTLTFIVIAVWVMPVMPETTEETEREYISIFCTALYEVGNLLNDYKELSVENVKKLKISIFTRINASENLRDQAEFTLDTAKYANTRQARLNGGIQNALNEMNSDQGEKKGDQGEKKDELAKLIVDLGGDANRRHKENNALNAMEGLLREIIVHISVRTNAMDSAAALKSMKEINQVLRKFTTEFINFLNKSGNKLCPLPDDFCFAITALENYKEFYQSILTIVQK